LAISLFDLVLLIIVSLGQEGPLLDESGGGKNLSRRVVLVLGSEILAKSPRSIDFGFQSRCPARDIAQEIFFNLLACRCHGPQNF